MKKYSIYTCLVFSTLFFEYACNPTRRLHDGEFLLNKNIIVDKHTKIERAQIESYIKQKPNRKILGIVRFHLGIYNLVNEDKANQKKIAHDKKIDAINLKRAAEGKKLKSKDHLTFDEWLLKIGEPPVIFDSTLMQKSAQQIHLFLNNKGYFDNTVRDSAVYKGKQVTTYYLLQTKKPYYIRHVNYEFKDPQLQPIIYADSGNCLVNQGAIYDLDILEKERDRLTTLLNNDGYFDFTKNYIYYSVDTTIGNRMLDVTIDFSKYQQQVSGRSDSAIEIPHPRYRINNVFVRTDYDPQKADKITEDTLNINDCFIIYSGKLNYRPNLFLNAIFIKKGDLYQLRNATDTYRRLSEIKAFKFINIRFVKQPGNLLDCYIEVAPVVKQAFTIETEGTNTSGDLGVSGSVIYQNKNLFKGAEVLQISFKGGIEAQKLVTTTGPQTTVQNFLPFNTLEFGPQATLTVPRFLTPIKVNAYKNADPQTVFTSALNYQRRPDYTRYIANLTFGYTWKESIRKTHTLNPLEISFVKVGLQPAFESSLLQTKDLLLINSYTNHMVTDSRYTFQYNDQDINRKSHNFVFFIGNLESSGNILRAFDDFTNAVKNSEGSYQILNLPYSQYLRADVDFRYYRILTPHSKLVFRTVGGMGYALSNLDALPFEKAFYAGGSNDIRAWRARTLGPGAYSATGETFDQVGDILMEGNMEYRFNIFRMLNAAAFMDAGNIWLRKPDPNRPGGEFNVNTFAGQIAIGAGLGLRVDFSFFIIRLDAAVPLKDPSYPINQRWQFGNHPLALSKINLNFGIGYPF
ncbi:MAG: BamA/TamA family outer membrane protein [Bacteroidia bacterium]